MDSFGSSPPSSGLPSLPEEQMDMLKTQMALDYVESLVEAVSSKCFLKCIPKPGTSLSGSESSCISRFVERYFEASGIVAQALFNPPR